MYTPITIFNSQERISHILMLNSFFLPDIGLYQGQMGVVLAMAKYSKRTESEVFVDFYYDLMEKVIEKVNKGLSFSLNNGLAGIGWGIEYLIQNGFVGGESVDICEEIDLRIMETDPRRMTDFSLETGFEGLLHYIVYHLQGAMMQKTKLPFDNAYLSDIYSVCKSIDKSNTSDSLQSLSQMYIQFIEKKSLPNYQFQLIDFATNVPELQVEKLATYQLGLNNGLSGALIQLVEEEKG